MTGKVLQVGENRGPVAIKLDGAARELIWRTTVPGYFFVTEYPKSGASWLCQMLSAYMGIPFPRNRFPTLPPAVLHGHHLSVSEQALKRTVAVVRDGRDVMVSAYYHLLFASDRNPHWFVQRMRAELNFKDLLDVRGNLPRFIEYMFERDRDRRRHFTWGEFIDHWMLPAQASRVVRYEDLLVDAPGTLRYALEALGCADINVERIAYICNRYSFQNQTRRRPGTQDLSSFLRKGVAGDWRQNFSKEAIDVFAHFAGEQLTTAGYDPTT